MTTRGRPVAVDSERIFVQIPSYRDRECQWTIRDAFARARYPARIFVGVCWQFDPEADQPCFEFEPNPCQVRRIDFHIRDARGLGWARAQAQSLWRGEEFTLQIDSHMRFVQDWDVLLLQELAACPSQWPVLTMYPPAYWPPDQREDGIDPLRAVQGIKGFTAAGMLQFTVHWASHEVPIDAPKPTAALAGGFVFTSSRMITDVPADPQVYFEGEEPGLAVRLYTHGFDLFCPRRAIVYHYYRRSDSRRPWDDRSGAEPDLKSRQRMRQLVEPVPGDAEALGRFGLGRARSLADYELFAGVDFRSRSVASYAFHYPFVHTDEVVEALISRIHLQPGDGVELFLLDDEGFLFVGARRAFLHLSREATFCWCAIEERMGLDALVEAFAERAGLELSTARRRVGALVCHWQAEGLLPGKQPAAVLGSQVTSCPRVPPLPPVGLDPIERSCALLGRRVRIRCYAESDAAIVAPLIDHFGDSSVSLEQSADLESVIEILGIGTWRYVATDNGFPAAAVASPSELAAAVSDALQVVARSGAQGLLHLRGAVVTDESGVTLLVGETQLVVRLAIAMRAAPLGGVGGLAGRCETSAPDLAARAIVEIDDGGMVQTLPQPLLVPEAMIKEPLPAEELAQLPRHLGFVWGSTVIPTYENSAPHGRRRVDRIVIVEPAAAGQRELSPIGPADALRRLVANATPEPALRESARAASLVAWIERTPAWLMRYSDVTDGIALLSPAASRPPDFATHVAPPRDQTLTWTSTDVARTYWPVESRRLRLRFASDQVREFLFRPTNRSDVDVVRRVFDLDDYDLDQVPPARALEAYLHACTAEGGKPLMVDADARIGASVVYFSLRFPGVRIVAVEPERRNLELLELNTRGLDVVCVDGAIGRHAGTGFVIDGPGDWEYSVSMALGRYPIPVVTVEDILADPRQAGTTPVICRISVDGGDYDLFEDDPAWIDRFPLLIIGLRDPTRAPQDAWRKVLRTFVSRQFAVIQRADVGFCFNERLLS